MTLEQTIALIPEKSLIKTAHGLALKGLPLWNAFCKQHTLAYVDSVVGMHHKIDSGILLRALQRYESALLSHAPVSTGPDNQVTQNSETVYNDFLEPVTALQDKDWTLPDLVEVYFYSVYNLLNYLHPTWPHDLRLQRLRIGTQQAVEVVDKAGFMTRQEIRKMLSA